MSTHTSEPQKLKTFQVEVWSNNRPGSRVHIGTYKSVKALDGYGAASYTAGRLNLKAEDWHDMDGCGQPPYIIRVFEAEPEYEYRMRLDGGMDRVKRVVSSNVK